jgi:hypothetical protein
MCDSETKFREYITDSCNLFNLILSFIKKDITRVKYNSFLISIWVEKNLFSSF